MKLSLLALMALPILLCARPSAALADCAGCEDLAAAASKLKKVQDTKDLRKHDEAQAGLARAIRRLPRRMDGTWTSEQSSAVIRALVVEKDHEYRQFILQPNAILFKDNRAAVTKVIARLPKDLAEAVQFDVDVILHELDHGNNSPDPKLLEEQDRLGKKEAPKPRSSPPDAK